MIYGRRSVRLRSKVKFFLVLFLSFWLGNSCTHSQKLSTKRPLVIAFYNQENLFDTEDDPSIDDAEFLPGSPKKWTPERYQRKLENMSRVISQLGSPAGPDILGLCEVENAKTVQDLANQPVLNGSYGFVHFDSPDGRGIDVALLYRKDRFRPINQQSRRITDPDAPEFKTRDILVVTGVLVTNDTMSILVNHWPSRRSGNTSVYKRKLAAQTAKSICDSLMKCFAKDYIVVMGDLNDEPDDESVRNVFGAKATQEQTLSEGFFNAMSPLKEQGKGSHLYKNQWGMLDQIILSYDLLPKHKAKGLAYISGSAAVFKADFLLETDPKYKGNPLRTYVGNDKYLGGYSDHLPVFIHLKLK